MKTKKFIPVVLLASYLFGNASATAEVVEYSSGHGDIGLAFEDDALRLHYHFGDGAVIDGAPLSGDLEYDPEEAYVRVGDNARVTTTADVSYLGTTAGDPVWLLPQSNSPGRPFLGLAAEELDDTFSNATLTMSSFSGPGEFALWQSGSLGGVNVLLQTNDGLSTDDMVNVAIGGHDHYNFGFTAEGIYDIGINAVADLAAGGSITDFGTFRFVVGNVTAVPEPGSIAVLAAVGAVIFVRRRRSR